MILKKGKAFCDSFKTPFVIVSKENVNKQPFIEEVKNERKEKPLKKISFRCLNYIFTSNK